MTPFLCLRCFLPTNDFMPENNFADVVMDQTYYKHGETIIFKHGFITKSTSFGRHNNTDGSLKLVTDNNKKEFKLSVQLFHPRDTHDMLLTFQQTNLVVFNPPFIVYLTFFNFWQLIGSLKLLKGIQVFHKYFISISVTLVSNRSYLGA